MPLHHGLARLSANNIHVICDAGVRSYCMVIGILATPNRTMSSRQIQYEQVSFCPQESFPLVSACRQRTVVAHCQMNSHVHFATIDPVALVIVFADLLSDGCDTDSCDPETV